MKVPAIPFETLLRSCTRLATDIVSLAMLPDGRDLVSSDTAAERDVGFAERMLNRSRLPRVPRG